MRTVNGWTWDDAGKRWYVIRGGVKIIVRQLTRNEPPDFSADLLDVEEGVRK